MRFTIIMLATCTSAIGWAAPTTEAPVQYAERTVIDFGRLDVRAPIQRPSMTGVFEVRRLSFNPLITLRSNFNPEMKASIHAVK
jgi:hypothetical protein